MPDVCSRYSNSTSSAAAGGYRNRQSDTHIQSDSDFHPNADADTNGEPDANANGNPDTHADGGTGRVCAIRIVVGVGAGHKRSLLRTERFLAGKYHWYPIGTD